MLSCFARTPTPLTTTAEPLMGMTTADAQRRAPCVADFVIPPKLHNATHDDPRASEGEG